MVSLYLIYIIVYFISFMTYGMIVHFMLHSKYSQKLIVSLWCIFSLLYSCERLLLIHYKMYSKWQTVYLLMSIAIFSSMTFYLYKDELWKKVAAIVIVHAIMFTADISVILGCKMTNPLALTSVLSVNANSIYLCLISSIVIILFSIFVLLVWSLLSTRQMMKNFLIMLLLPVSQLLFIENEYAYNLNHINRISYMFIIAELLGSILDIYWVYELIYRSRQAEAEMMVNELQHAMKTEEIHYAQIEEKREIIAQIRHDLKNQLNAAKILTEIGEREQAIEMLDSISEALNQTNEYPFCNIAIINAVLNNKNEICKRNHIVLDANINLPGKLAIDNVVLCSIFSNILDNAVQAASDYEGEEKWVKVRGIYEGGILAVKVTNTANQPKKIREGHGTGTKILNHIAEMYNGAYRHEYEDGKFKAIITLEVKNESGNM